MKKVFTGLMFFTFFGVHSKAQTGQQNFSDKVSFFDTYHHVASIKDSAKWNLYNVHDPSVYKEGDYYYMYSTDASWGGAAKNGALKRRSTDLVNWEYMGNAFDGVPQSAQDFFKNNGNPNYTDQGIWAPFLFKLRNKYILYYSAPGGLDGVNFAYLGYATSNSANGPWDDQGMITYSYKDTINAIDPSVIYDSLTNRLWMAYGSWFTGLYVVEMDTATGGIKTPGDKGKRIANRFSNSQGQEGPELSYRNGWYYLYLSYDGLGDLYNVRVGRSRTPDGPYYDFLGNDLTNKSNNIPMILAPYAFNNHFGWQGTGHCGVFNDNGQYYMFHQGRPTVEPGMIVGHVREIKWIDNWPVLSPERYTGGASQVSSTTILPDNIAGEWEHINLNYHSSTASDYLSHSATILFDADGTFNGSANNTWTLSHDTLNLIWNDGATHKLIVFEGWDWENECKTLLYTGIKNSGICAWGKKIIPAQTEKFNTIIDGATYTLRNAYSHLLMQLPDTLSGANTAINQGVDMNLESQLWTIRKAGNGNVYLLPRSGDQQLVLEVQNGSTSNGANLMVANVANAPRQQFKLNYLANGYYTILTKASNHKACADLYGFDVNPGGVFKQWEYLGGWNQKWRIERIDSIAIDLSAEIDTLNTGFALQNAPQFEIYPNPGNGTELFIKVSSATETNLNLAIIDVKGVLVHTQAINYGGVNKLTVNLTSGLYLVTLQGQNTCIKQKLIVH